MNRPLRPRLLPDRFNPIAPPYRWIDRILEQTDRLGRMLKNITCDEWCPAGGPLPDCFLLEAMAQAAGLQDEFLQAAHPPHPLVLARIPSAEFHYAPVPGDQVVLVVEPRQLLNATARYAVRAEVDGKLAAAAAMVLLRDPRR